MPTYVTDPAWLAVWLAIVAIAIPFWIFKMQATKKELVAGVMYSSSLLALHEEVKDRVEITLDGVRVQSVLMSLVRVANKGNVAIQAGDFHKPITIELPDSSTLVSAELESQVPQDLGVVLNHENRYLTVKSLLLNPGDAFTIKLVTADTLSSPVVSARIAGISKLTDPSLINKAVRQGDSFGFWLGTVLSLVLASASLTLWYPTLPRTTLVTVSAFALAAIFLLRYPGRR